MTRSRFPGIPLSLAVLALALSEASGGEPTLRPGTRLSELPVGGSVLREVEVRSINARTVVVTHAGGLSSVRLRDLAPEWQQRFGYDPAADAAAEQNLAQSAAKPASGRPAASRAVPPRSRASTAEAAGFEALVQAFGTPAVLRREVDLRPQYFQLELAVKDQGRRPSCAVFAIVSALEFQNARLTGQPEKFSEEYLIWATRKTLHRAAVPPARDVAPAAADDADEGFALLEVVAALRGYGIALHAAMPNTFGRAMAEIAEPPADVVTDARRHQRVFIHLVPGRDNATRINNLVHALNSERPVPVGIAWPHYRTLRDGYLSQQEPLAASGHAVTLVGYHAPTDRVEDLVFIFKNSWGVNWGQAGYGTVTYAYLLKHLHSAVVLELQRG